MRGLSSAILHNFTTLNSPKYQDFAILLQTIGFSQGLSLGRHVLRELISRDPLSPERLSITDRHVPVRGGPTGWTNCADPTRLSIRITIMKLSTIALAGALALSSTYAFAQAGEGDANFAGGGYDGGSYGSPGFSGAYGAYDPSWQNHAWESEVRPPRLTLAPRRRARLSTRIYSN